MAVQIWTGGAGDGNFGTAGNWASGVAPVNSDTVVFSSGNVSVTAGLTTGLTGITLIVTSGYGGNIGDTSGNPLSFGTTLVLKYGGVGAYARFTTTGTATSATLTHTATAVALTGGTWTDVYNGVGPLDIAAATVVTNLYNTGGPITAGYNGTAFTILENGGVATIKRAITTADQFRGSLTHQDNGTSNYLTVGTIRVHPGATYNKQSGGTDTTVKVFPNAKFTIVGTSGGSAGTVTVTNLYEYQNSSVQDNHGGFTLTVTNRYKIGVVGTSFT